MNQGEFDQALAALTDDGQIYSTYDNDIYSITEWLNEPIDLKDSLPTARYSHLLSTVAVAVFEPILTNWSVIKRSNDSDDQGASLHVSQLASLKICPLLLI